MEQPSPDKI